MKQEPVGVVCEFEGIMVGTLFEKLPDGTPLYTAPRQLSDEEIMQVYEDCFKGDKPVFIVGFARAILRKAWD